MSDPTATSSRTTTCQGDEQQRSRLRASTTSRGVNGHEQAQATYRWRRRLCRLHHECGVTVQLALRTSTSWPAAFDAATSAASFRPVGSAASILMPGLSALAATAIPLIIPPPLTGTMMASSCGTCTAKQASDVGGQQPPAMQSPAMKSPAMKLAGMMQGRAGACSPPRHRHPPLCTSPLPAPGTPGQWCPAPQ